MPRFTQRRARGGSPIIVGLTGSIAMGKSTAAKMIREMGIPVFDSDASSRALTATGGAAIPAITKRFPGVMVNGQLDRQALAKLVFSSPRDLVALEAIVHPLVKAARQKFVRQAKRARRRVLVFDVPLLFETKSEHQCDIVIVISAPAFLQRQRALARPGMDQPLLSSVLSRQIPDAVKRTLADVVVPSGLGKAETLRRLKKTFMSL